MIKNYTDWLNESEKVDPTLHLTPEQIAWCDKNLHVDLSLKKTYKLKNQKERWWVNNKGEVVVSGDKIYIRDTEIEKFPVKFAPMIYEDATFWCDGCTSLKTLEGSPETVKYFYSRGCTSLQTLKGGPKKTWSFECEGCTSLKTLDGAPSETYIFGCSNCTSLQTLKGSPNSVGKFWCSNTGIKNLVGGPSTVERDFACNRCSSLETLEGAPVSAKVLYYEESKVSPTMELLRRAGVIGPKMPFFDEDEELEGEFRYEDSPLFVEWVKSGKSWKDLLEKHKGKIAGSRYGL